MKNALARGNKWRRAELAFLFSILSPAYALASSDTASQEIAKNVEFDPGFLNLGEGKKIDLSRFANGASALPGIYRTIIYVNDNTTGTYELEFKSAPDNRVYPCLTREIIKDIPFKYDKLPADFSARVAGEDCINLHNLAAGIRVNYDSNEQRLDIVIPQLYIQQYARGYVNKNRWDSGIPAALLGYNASAYSSESGGTRYKTLYAGLNAGINIASWYLRHNGSWNWTEHGQKKYSAINTYLQHDIPALDGRILLGQSYTSGQLFDSFPFSGIQFASDEKMLPNSLRGYAPEIRGIARTSARVTVRQGSQVIYETTVPPGDFLLNDLYPTGYGGNLDVTIRESDGSEQYFSVPYSSVAQLLRPGNSRYAITAGKLRSNSLSEKPAIYQATLQYGLNNMLTAYSGLQASPHYYALQAGTALGTEFGAFSLDATQARTRLGNGNDGSQSGQSYQLSYSKTVSDTSSQISLAAYRFSTGGYMDFLTAEQTRQALRNGLSSDTVWRAKNRFVVNVSQGLPDSWGRFYLSSSLQNYWNRDGSSKQYQLGYNNTYKKLTWGMSVNRTYSLYGTTQNNYLLNFSLPLGRNDEAHTPQLRVDLAHNTTGRSTEQASVSGTAGSVSQFGYNATAANANQGTGSSGSLSGSWRSPVSHLNAGYSKGAGYKSFSAGMSGTLIGHAGGLTLTPYTSDTFALVEAKGAQGASVSTYPGIYVDWNGYAVVPHLNAYQLNEISLDPNGIASDVELGNTTLRIAPWSGAVVKVKYDTFRGTPLLITATYQGDPVAFGASVVDSKGNHVGMVGQGGEVYVRVQEERGELQVQWGEGPGMQCSLNYVLMPQAKGARQSEIQRFNSVCEAMADSQPARQKMADVKNQNDNVHG
ncbi:fimbria/pilus outer membrane usher protein [Erwinia phyllosphaerae]|uniref:fimbria/pilus outer membrane usher protein n=1 Tax=Erwinia phyllosphaerae TaxID=2853256 RepID=UPI001FEE5C51|nr:fimbria/pilus outer membrane usher protein [Erwinia phyllosphaerae]MBV4367238.1 fimbrial biogenesis outer membrane usher protein [Erwinia phyllosphaerae]